MAQNTFNQESIFNEALLKMQRIHTAQEILNNVRINLLAWNEQYGKYNYEVAIANMNSLCYEVYPVMKPNEQKEFYLLRNLTDDLLSYKPIYEKVKSSNFNGSQNKEKLNESNWNLLKKVMFKFEDFARVQIDSHGYASPKKKDATRAVVDL